MRKRIRIGELARRTGATVKALRLYDSLGLLVAAGRSETNYRVFGEETVCCVHGIRELQAAGFTLRDLQELAAAHRRGEDTESFLPDKLPQILQRLDDQIARLEAKRTQLRRLLEDPAPLCCQLAS